MADERDVAGIRCGEVLGVLDDYVDGGLDAETRERIEAHLTACDWCEHFGGAYATIVRTLREGLAASAPMEADAKRRLRERLGLLP